MKTFYHATDFKNLNEIIEKGIECRNVEHLVYLCEDEKDCLKFAFLHGVKDVLVLQVKVFKADVIETFDHSSDFFKCRCFASKKEIPSKNIRKFIRYKFEV